MDQIVNAVMKLQNQPTESDMALGRLIRENSEVEKSLSNLLRAMEQGVFSETTLARLQELEKRQKKLEQAIVEQRAKQDVQLDEATIRSYYHAAVQEHLPSMVFLLVKKIILYDDRAEVYLQSPLPNSPDEDRGCFLFTRKETIGQKRKGGAPLRRRAVTVNCYLSGK